MRYFSMFSGIGGFELGIHNIRPTKLESSERPEELNSTKDKLQQWQCVGYSEIDKYATKVSEANYPDIIRLGDVTKWEEWDLDWSSIDLVTGGFPCQAWSMAGKQLGDKDERGMLFWTMLDVMKNVREHNPKAHFLIETSR